MLRSDDEWSDIELCVFWPEEGGDWEISDSEAFLVSAQSLAAQSVLSLCFKSANSSRLLVLDVTVSYPQ